MPIEIQDLDGGRGSLIVSRGVVSDQELRDFGEIHLTQDTQKFRTYKYIILDHSELAKLDISDATVDGVAGLFADTARANPDAVVAVIAYATYGANLDLLKRIERLHELFIYRSNWETMLFRTRPQAVRWIRERVRDKFGVDGLTFS